MFAGKQFDFVLYLIDPFLCAYIAVAGKDKNDTQKNILIMISIMVTIMLAVKLHTVMINLPF